jgi:hypothetical protein
MNHKSLILAVLLLPSFCSSQTKEEKKIDLMFKMNALMLQVATLDHQMIVALWSTVSPNDEFIAQIKKEALELALQSERLNEQFKDLNEQQ